MVKLPRTRTEVAIRISLSWPSDMSGVSDFGDRVLGGGVTGREPAAREARST
jgi:hypothetical protein